jgi:anaerobic ribonucleoside-triphosphate reductase activating protein
MQIKMLNIAGFIKCSFSDGPGKRFAIWVKGCDRRCDGCTNYSLQSKEVEFAINPKSLFSLVESSISEGIEGVTISGGEPMLQWELLSRFYQECQEVGLSVMVFTGYMFEDLSEDMVKHIDILVDGPYEKNKLETKRNWVGSTNQRFFFLSDRYKQGIEFEPVDCFGRITPHDCIPDISAKGQENMEVIRDVVR